MRLRQLFPQTREVEILDLTAGLAREAAGESDRPHTLVNFVASLDGRATFHGRSGALGDAADREMFHALRAQADAVLAGTTTVRVERYGRAIRDPEVRERRRMAGRSPEPLMAMASRSGTIPTEAPVFAEPEARIALFTPRPVDLAGAAAQVQVIALDPGEATLTTVFRRLHRDFDIRLLLCEGGPTLFAALLQERLVDELFLTLAPKLAGGGPSPPITQGPELPELQELELVWALEHAGSLFLRYRVS